MYLLCTFVLGDVSAECTEPSEVEAMPSSLDKHCSDDESQTSKDIMAMMKALLPNSEALDGVTYESIWKVCGETTCR